MDVDARSPEHGLGPVMMQEQDFGDPLVVPNPDPWSGWAQVYELPASVEYDLDDEQDESRRPPPDESAGLAAVVTQLTGQLADERARRANAEDALRQTQSVAHAAEVEKARLTAELAADRSRASQLERDRDEVIRRAEELLTAVRERADLRLAAELDAARRHWSELLAEERRRVEVLDGERAALTKRLEDAWLVGAVLRRSRPLRPWSSDEGDEHEDEDDHDDAAVAEESELPEWAESPELAAEIEHLRERLRAQLHKPPGLPAVEAGVDRLRESRLARDAEGSRRRR